MCDLIHPAFAIGLFHSIWEFGAFFMDFILRKIGFDESPDSIVIQVWIIVWNEKCLSIAYIEINGITCLPCAKGIFPVKLSGNCFIVRIIVRDSVGSAGQMNGVNLSWRRKFHLPGLLIHGIGKGAEEICWDEYCSHNKKGSENKCHFYRVL